MDSEANYQKISEVVALSYKKFEEEGITEEITMDAKIVQLAEIEEDLKKTMTKLEWKRIPGTPVEVMERRHDTTTQATKRIEEVKKICAKGVEEVSNTWESLMVDEQSHNITSHLTSVEKNIT